MSRLSPFIVLMGACAYMRPPADPADPVTFSLLNASDTAVYLALPDGVSPFGGAIQLSRKDGDALVAAPGCALSCLDGCSVVACTPVAAVRVLAPGEAWLVDWNGMRWDEGVLSCAGAADRSCVNGTRAKKGRYAANICHAHSFVSTGATRTPESILAPAIPSDSSCQTVFFSYPSYDVRYQVSLN